MTYIPYLFRITAQTNLHVGSGKQNYGIIDNLIQRDALTGYPNINASSLKGALREFFTQHWGKDDPRLNFIFGKDSTKEEKDNRAGEYRFFDAHLFSLPIRSDATPFFRTTASDILDHLQKRLAQHGRQLAGAAAQELKGPWKPGHHFLPMVKEAILEDPEIAVHYADVEKIALETAFGEPMALLDHGTFSELCDDNHLPVIARNSLENGRSVNLWYEQILPRQSVFFALMLVPEVRADKSNYFDDFEGLLTNQTLVQIGANASIGNGFCSFRSVALEPLPSSAK